MENLWIRKILLSVRGLVHELCKDSWLMNIFFGSGMVNPSWFIKIGGSARKNGHFAGKKANNVSGKLGFKYMDLCGFIRIYMHVS